MLHPTTSASLRAGTTAVTEGAGAPGVPVQASARIRQKPPRANKRYSQMASDKAAIMVSHIRKPYCVSVTVSRRKSSVRRRLPYFRINCSESTAAST